MTAKPADHCMELTFKAKLAEQAERYDEMCEFMAELSKEKAKAGDGGLSVEERNLLSVAYKNKVGSRRASWRIVNSVVEKSKNKLESKPAGDKAEHEWQYNAAIKYREMIESELHKICHEILKLLDDVLIKQHTTGSKDDSNTNESIVFYYKMKGDYYRYISELAGSGEKGDGSKEKALEAYEKARESSMLLKSTHPIRLGLALNFSVFYYEIMNDSAKACKMAKDSFDDAIAVLDTVSEDSYRDSTLIMQLLRDNLTLWSSTEDAALDDGKEAPQESAGGSGNSGK